MSDSESSPLVYERALKKVNLKRGPELPLEDGDEDPFASPVNPKAKAYADRYKAKREPDESPARTISTRSTPINDSFNDLFADSPIQAARAGVQPVVDLSSSEEELEEVPAKRPLRGRAAKIKKPKKTPKKTRAASSNLNANLRQLESLQSPEVIQCSEISYEEILDHGEDLTTSTESEMFEVRINFKGTIKKLPMLRAANFYSVIENILALFDIPKESRGQIALCLADKEISFDETPTSLQLTIASILRCFLKETQQKENGQAEPVDPNAITIKLRRSKPRNDVTTLKVSQIKELSLMMEEYATLVDMPLSKLVFEFDGDIIKGSETPRDLDMEDGSLIDVKVKVKS